MEVGQISFDWTKELNFFNSFVCLIKAFIFKNFQNTLLLLRFCKIYANINVNCKKGFIHLMAKIYAFVRGDLP